MANANLTAQRLRELLTYDPESGIFKWAVPRQGTNTGKSAGYTTRLGYSVIKVDGVRYMAHRLAFLYVEGFLPTADIDHIDGSPSNNCFKNLREVSRAGNIQNQNRPHKNNPTGLLGVQKRGNKWRAVITADGTRRWLGTFDAPAAASAAYLQAKRLLHSTCTI